MANAVSKFLWASPVSMFFVSSLRFNVESRRGTALQESCKVNSKNSFTTVSIS